MLSASLNKTFTSFQFAFDLFLFIYWVGGGGHFCLFGKGVVWVLGWFFCVLWIIIIIIIIIIFLFVLFMIYNIYFANRKQF